jgi:hypothetical protein
MKTKLYGWSDDNIEIEGAITDELATNGKEHFSCSDGTKGIIQYSHKWDIAIKEQGVLFEKIVLAVPDETPHTDEDAKGCTSYSDVLVLNDGIEWIKIKRKTFKI